MVIAILSILSGNVTNVYLFACSRDWSTIIDSYILSLGSITDEQRRSDRYMKTSISKARKLKKHVKPKTTVIQHQSQNLQY